MHPTSSTAESPLFSASSPTPTLDTKILSGYYLHKCISEYIEISDEKEILTEKETWMTVTPNELEKAEIWKPGQDKRIRYSIINVETYYLGSPKDALIFANMYFSGHGGTSVWSEGSYTGQPIGDRTWTNKDSHIWKEDANAYGYENGLFIVFVKGSEVIRVNGWSLPFANNPNPMRPEFVENVAKAIDNKLKRGK